MSDNSSTKFVARLLKLLGGVEKAREILNKSYEEEVALWEQPTGTIGRILRAHIYLEYHLTQYLQARNPNLPDLNSARLSFAQKLALVHHSDKQVAHLICGVRQVNSIRNRMGHRLNASIDSADIDVLLSNSLFSSFRTALSCPLEPNDDAVDIIENFAKFAGAWFKNSVDPSRHVWAEASRPEDSSELID